MADITRSEHVTRNVIGALIVAGIVGSVGYFWQDVTAGIRSGISWLGEPVSIARWWYGLLLLVVVLGACIIVLALAVSRAKPEHAEYTEDTFFGFVWRWRWVGSEIDGLWCFCVACDRAGSHSIDRYEQTTTLFCQHCQRPAVRLGMLDQTLREVRREIDVKVRNGRWREVVESQKTPA